MLSLSNIWLGCGIFLLISPANSCNAFENSVFTIFIILVRNILVIALIAAFIIGSSILPLKVISNLLKIRKILIKELKLLFTHIIYISQAKLIKAVDKNLYKYNNNYSNLIILAIGTATL